MNEFEELAHRAADAARDRTAALGIPDLPTRRRPVVVAGGCLLVVALVGIGIALASRDDGSRTDVAGDPIDGVPISEWPIRLVWAADGAGDEVGARDLPLDFSAPIDANASQTLLFGGENEDDPFLDGDLLIATFDGSELSGSDFSGDEVEVRGTTGYEDSLTDSFGFNGVVAWVETDTLAVVVASRSFDTEALVELAETLSFSDQRAQVTEPLGLTLVATLDELPFGAGVYGRTGGLSSRVSENQDEIAVLWSEPERPVALLLARYMAVETQPVTVRGVEGWLLQPGAPGQGYGGDSVVWVDRGVMFTVSVSPNLDPIALADELIEIDEAQWAQMVADADAEEQAGQGETITEGTFAFEDQEVTRRLSLDDNALCFFLRTGSAGTSSCGSVGAVTFKRNDHPESNATVVAYGSVGATVDRIVFAGETNVDIPIHRLGDARFFGVAVAATGVEPDLVAYSDNGSEVWRLELDELTAPPPVSTFAPPIELASGVSGSIEWDVQQQGESLCLNLSGTSEGSGSCAGNGYTWVTLGGSTGIAGIAPPCIDRVVVSVPDRPDVTATLFEHSDGQGYFALLETHPDIEVSLFSALDNVTTFRLAEEPAEINC